MAVYKTNKKGYGLSNPLIDISNVPVKAKRAPTSKDFVELGTIWIDQPNQDVYIAVDVSNNSMTWINTGGGSGSFDSLTVTNDTTVGNDITATAGDITAAAGNVIIPGIGQTYPTIVQVAADGTLTSSNSGETNGNMLIGGASGLAWNTLTAGAGINIANGDGTVTISNPGATGTTMTTSDGNTVSPDGTGDTKVIGYDANITTDGATANTVKIRLSDDVTTVGALTAGVNFTVSAGQTTINSSTNVGQDIYLHADGGVNETIQLHSDQGTGNDSIYLLSDVGGIRAVSSGYAGADSISLIANDAAGGITFGAGTGGLTTTIINGDYTLHTGTGAIGIGTDNTDHNITLGHDTGANALTLVSGTSAMTFTAGGAFDVNATGAVTIDSTGGELGLGTGADANNINIGTGAAQRTTTIGNSTAASSVIVDVGTGNLDLGVTATDHTTRLGSTTGDSPTTIQSGLQAMTFTAGGAFDVNATGAVTIDSTGGTLGIGTGDDANNINIGTGAAARIITVGNGTGATSVVLNSGTGNLDLGVNATDHTTRLGSTAGDSPTTIQSGLQAMTFTAGGAFDVNASGDITMDTGAGIFDVSVSGAVTIDSSGGTIGIGVDSVNKNINIGTQGTREVIIGNQTNANSGVTIEGGGTSGISLNGSGMTSLGITRVSSATATITIDAYNGGATFTGVTTAAGATQQFTINNTVCTANSYIQLTIMNKGANDARIMVQRITPAAGSFTVDTINNGTQANNGDIIITFWIYRS